MIGNILWIIVAVYVGYEYSVWRTVVLARMRAEVRQQETCIRKAEYAFMERTNNAASLASSKGIDHWIHAARNKVIASLRK